MIIGLGVIIARDVVLESAVIEFQRRLATQRHERRLRSRWRAAVRWRLREQGLPVWIHDHNHGLPEEHPHHHRWFDWLSRLFESFARFVSRGHEDPAWKFQYGSRQKRLNIEALSDVDWNAAALETGAPVCKLVPEALRMLRRDSAERPHGVPLSNRPTIDNGNGVSSPHSLTHFRLGGMLAILGNFAIAVSHGAPTEADAPQNTNDGTTPQPEAPTTAVDENSNEEEPSLRRSAPLGVPLTITATINEDDFHTEASLEKDAQQMIVARLFIAFSLFLAFWLVRQATFCATLLIDQIVFSLDL